MNEALHLLTDIRLQGGGWDGSYNKQDCNTTYLSSIHVLCVLALWLRLETPALHSKAAHWILTWE